MLTQTHGCVCVIPANIHTSANKLNREKQALCVTFHVLTKPRGRVPGPFESLAYEADLPQQKTLTQCSFNVTMKWRRKD